MTIRRGETRRRKPPVEGQRLSVDARSQSAGSHVASGGGASSVIVRAEAGASSRNDRLGILLLGVALLACILWAYRSIIGEMVERWADDPQYSHGFFVPLFSAFLLWFHRDRLIGAGAEPSWWGLVALAAALGFFAAGSYFFVSFFAAVSLLCSFAGLALVLGGLPALRWSWPAILFLGFMVPLPYRLYTALGGGLQRVATVMSTYVLQTLGAPAIREGNVILIEDVKIGVVEACSGLGMLVTFFALATAIAMLLRSSAWPLRAALVASAVPVAILANVCRITVTGLLYSASQDQLARIVFHDVAGWLMMPLAIALLLGELHVLRRLLGGPSTAAEGDNASIGLPGFDPEACARPSSRHAAAVKANIVDSSTVDARQAH
jgi:exosortase